MNESGITQGVVAGFSSILGGFVGCVIGLSVGHTFFIANTVNYNTDLPEDGVELSVKHWGESIANQDNENIKIYFYNYNIYFILNTLFKNKQSIHNSNIYNNNCKSIYKRKNF
ncbi:hypothetical protein [uncultured Gemella sp.]|uniref:hypothetical protein n=1 Tax=uncultured Gemella sp. TaxID=254352 RepID=UPI0028D57051|nr:hypothetical protein [uncultured Gemella sp.]